MAQYKPYSYAQGQFIPVFFNKQIQKGTFEYTLQYLGDNQLLSTAKILADSGYHSENNMEYLFTENIDGYVVDKLFRKRDPCFITASRYKELTGFYFASRAKYKRLFRPANFTFAKDLS